MNSRVSWSVDSIDPSVRKRAEAAARRAGLSLNEWLDSRLGDSAPPNFRERDHRANTPSRETREVADIHRRLDLITRQIERISRPPSEGDDAGAEQAVARQLNDAISRLDARLSQISNRAVTRPVEDGARDRAQERVQEKVREKIQEKAREKSQQKAQESSQGRTQDRIAANKAEQLQDSPDRQVERAAAQVYRNAPPLSPVSLDAAVAEITARQSELDSGDTLRSIPLRESAPPPAPPAMREPAPVPAMREAAPMPPAPPAIPAGADFSLLERYLLNITSQIEALQRPNDEIEQSIASFRSELAEIRQALTEAMPRRAIEQIESDIRALARRIDENRQSGSDAQALAGIERALGEIREVLRSLTPAEQLTGYDEAIRNLTAKLDLIVRESDDPGTVEQLESAISALRAIVSNIASNDALARLADDVRLLSTKVDQLTRPTDNADSFAMLEQRIAALTAALESRERPSPTDNSEQLEGALRSLTERIDRLQVGSDSASALAHLEQRVSYLLERLETSNDHRSGNLVRVEVGLQDVLRHLERQQETFAALVESRRSAPPPPPDPGLFDLVKRELSDIRFSQTETDRLTQDSLEAVHNTLGHVVDRLAMIETDLRATRAAPLQPITSPTLAPSEPPMPAPGPAMTQQARPELPNPAASQAPFNQPPFNQAPFAAAPRDFQAASAPIPAISAIAPKAISEILEPHAAAPRPALAPDLPPDHPLEPGTRPGARLSTPSERIAASESAISEIPASPREPVSSSSFIAAARRAAQAAAAQPANDKSSRKPPKGTSKGVAKSGDKSGDKAKDSKTKAPSTTASKIRSVLVGVSVVVIVLAVFKTALSLLDGGPPPAAPAVESIKESAKEPPPPQMPQDTGARPFMPDPATPSLTSPTPIGRQSFNNLSPSSTIAGASVDIPAAGSDVTGTIAAPPTGSAGRKSVVIQIPANEKLPEAIGGPALRAAALKGDPAAAYEIGLRFAEGKGVASNLEEAAKWYDRAAQAGVIPAVFRLGTFYEKGLGLKRDIDLAHRYYLQAAERGNAKAMHNLAVLDADGGGKGANYTTASAWFRKAADRGVADSQYNLGILYARGIGVEQNLAESYKWFSLAASQGDADAGRKRDDVAKRLDPQSLAAARLAIQTFTAEPQPEDAVIVPTPAGGWDNTPAQTEPAKPAAKPAAVKRTALVR
jgi:localization factor PodJL